MESSLRQDVPDINTRPDEAQPRLDERPAQ
jgi:hypothetical protein